MFHKRKLIMCLSLSILLAGILSGCGSKEPICLYDEIVLMEKEVLEEGMECNQVGIYVDSTPSMEGYIGWHGGSIADNKYPNADKQQEQDYRECVPITVYNQCLDIINNVIASKYDEKSIDYYSINTTLWESKINVLEEASYLRYYGNSNNKNGKKEENIKYVMVEEYEDKYSGSYDNPSISYAIEKAMQDDFAVIITDLYENEGNANVIIHQLKKIKEQGESGKSIGMLGIRSEFAGIIYDLPDGSTMDYGVVPEGEKFTKEDVRFRPFYILLIGDSKHIDNFIQEFEKNMEKTEIKKAVWNSKKISGLDYRDYAEYKVNGLYEMPQMEIGIRNTTNDEKLKQRVAEIDESKIERKEKIYLFYDINSPSLENFLREQNYTESTEICVAGENIAVVKADNLEIKSSCLYQYEGEENKSEVSSDIQKAMNIEEIYWSKEEGKIVIELNFEKSRIASGTYVYKADVNRCVDEIVPEWIDEWNLSIDAKDGSKTQNLRNIYIALNNKFSVKEQEILKMQFYFKTRGR